MMKFVDVLLDQVRPIRLMDQPIPSEYREPLSYDDRFHSYLGATIFLAEGIKVPRGRSASERLEDVRYTHSKRMPLELWRTDLARAENDAREEVGNNDTAAYYQAMLQRAYGDPTLELKHILAGLTFQDNGFPFLIYGTVSAPNRAVNDKIQ